MANKWTAAQIPSQQGKLAIVTGGNSGIGFQTARELARAGASVIIACRSAAKGNEARQRIVAEIPNAQIEVGLLDLADLDSVRRFSAGFLASGRALDLLINNAGIMALPARKLTPQGNEMQFGTNHLGHFALTGLLLPAVLRAPAGRIVTVSSIAHRGGVVRFDDLTWTTDYKPMVAYRQSKAANLLFGFELQRRLETAGARAVSIVVHPGVSRTSLVANGPGSEKSPVVAVIGAVFALFQQPEEQGALPTLFAATSPDAKGGKYYGPDGFKEMRGYPVEVQPEAAVNDPRTAARLWQVSEELTGVA